uniref:Elongation of very long chain fatty acids protein n=1 Tax=Caenorhabditis japonica TaxID=281687 RepID=A0A8R1I574_CAEJA
MLDQILGTNFNYESAKEVARGLEGVSAKLAVAYVLLIFSLKYYMKDRKAFDLSTPLNVWNGILSTFSLLGFLAVFPTLLSVIRKDGVTHTYSQVSELYTDDRSGYWIFLWVLSKIPELMDTVFIVLRKRPLIFMHWYHHALTGYYAIVCYHEDAVHMVWVVWMNYIIHAFMYGYYLLKSLKFNIPPSVAQAITTSQMIQFAISIFAQVHVTYRHYVDGVEGLAYSFRGTAIGFFMLTTYFYLWIQFYKEHYLHNGGKKYNLAKKDQKKAN